MPFDEDLRRQLETLSDRIRDEVTRQLAIATGELTASFEAERSAAVSQAAADASAAAEQGVAARLTAAVAAVEQEAAARLTDTVAAAEQEAATRLTEAVAAAEARGRVAGRETGERDGLAKGRLEGHDDTRAEARAAERAASEQLIEAVRAIDRARSLSEILDTLASCARREAARVGVLLVRGGELRAWRFIGFDAALGDGGTFALPPEEAGIIAEAARTGEAVFSDGGHGATAPSFAKLPPACEMLAVPIPMGGQVVAVLYADQGADAAARQDQAEARVVWPAILEVLARHATRCLEATTAFRAAQLLLRPEASAAPSASRAMGGSGAGSARASTEANKGDEDEAARRYARLLISEIKLYHEPEVIAGRRDRDVAVRLGGEIARARGLYEQRVPAHVRSATDHFQAELVRTLANGDPSLLGQST